MMLNNKQVRQLIKSKGNCVGTDYLDNLEVELQNIIESSLTRCKLNGRRTVYPRDL